MPSRWFVPVPGLDPTRVRLDFVHAAVSGWFDLTSSDHHRGDKPYAISPVTTDDRGVTGIEVATFTDKATRQLHAAVHAAVGAPGIRLGNQWRQTRPARLLHHITWAELAAPSPTVQWRVLLATPATFRTGDRTSPLPTAQGLVRTARSAWAAWGERPLPHGAGGTLWVSDLDLRSEVLSVPLRGADGAFRDVVVSGVLGSLVLRHDKDDPAAGLVRLAAYTGIGAMTRKGLGVARVEALRSTAQSGAARGVAG